MIKALEVPIDSDLLPLSVYWSQKNITHRISESEGKQIIWISNKKDIHQIRNDFDDFSRGRLQLQVSKKNNTTNKAVYLNLFLSYPMTLCLVILSIFGFCLVEFQFNTIVDLLRIQLIDRSNLSNILNLSERISPAEFLDHGQYWRLITPIFLHFGWVHLTFNMLWLWELGRRIENQFGSIHFISVVFFVSVLSNIYQTISTPLAFFGGMSGVVYGLLGYFAIFTLITPKREFILPSAIYIVMLLALILGYLGVLPGMANTAHLTGLIWGCFIAIPSAVLSRFFDSKISNNS